MDIIVKSEFNLMNLMATHPSAINITRTPQELFDEVFGVARDPRSPAYKAGVLNLLQFALEGIPIPKPYEMGTAEADAFYAGVNEGWMIIKRENSKNE